MSTTHADEANTGDRHSVYAVNLEGNAADRINDTLMAANDGHQIAGLYVVVCAHLIKH